MRLKNIDKFSNMFFILMSLVLSLQLAAANTDNLGVLSGTLKTYQRAVCNEEKMSIMCPPGTSIAIAFARYGQATDVIQKCNNNGLHLSDSTVLNSNDTCALPRSIQTVVEICQKKRNCKFNTSPKNFPNDPCPNTSKFTEVAYKCRPYEFRSKVACENDAVNLVCYPGQRVAIYSAAYGRTEYESLQCPQRLGIMEETCSAFYASETVRKMCHGKRRCTVIANESTFGDPCKRDSRTYLKIVYTCVPRSVLRNEFAGSLESDEIELEDDIDEGFDRTDFNTEFSPSPNLESPQIPPKFDEATDFTTIGSSPRAQTTNDKNQEKFYLYIVIAVAASVMLLLSLLIGRVLVNRYKEKGKTKFQENNETLPNGFADEISEIDADIDLSTSTPVPLQETRIPETQLIGTTVPHQHQHYCTNTRLSMLPPTIHHHSALQQQQQQHHPTHHQASGIRDLGNQMIGVDNLQTILCTDNLRNITNKSFYYG